MRHRKVGRKLNRTASHRRALLSSLSTALIKHKKIRTTLAKAKETRRIVEPIITRARDAFIREKAGTPIDVHARREVAKFIRDKDVVQILFTDVAEKVGKRPGGYTRVLPLGSRQGDGAEMAVIELVDYNVAQDSKTRAKRVERSKAAAERRKKTAPADTELRGAKKADEPAVALDTEALAPEPEIASPTADMESETPDVEREETDSDSPPAGQEEEPKKS